MNKGQVGSIKLVFDDTGLVGLPVIVNSAKGQGSIKVIKEPRKGQVFRRVFTPPDPDKAVGFISRIAHYLESIRHSDAFSVGGY